jgi:hypothetical protein
LDAAKFEFLQPRDERLSFGWQLDKKLGSILARKRCLCELAQKVINTHTAAAGCEQQRTGGGPGEC